MSYTLCVQNINIDIFFRNNVSSLFESDFLIFLPQADRKYYLFHIISIKRKNINCVINGVNTV